MSDNKNMEHIKSCNCTNALCKYVLIVSVPGIGTDPHITTEQSCNLNQMLANKDQTEHEFGDHLSVCVYQRL